MRKRILTIGVFIASLLIGVSVASLPLLWGTSRLPDIQVLTLENDQPNQPIDQSEKPKQPSVYEWEESFSNEKDICRRRKNKVEIQCVSKNDRIFAEIVLSSRLKSGEWTRKQSLRFENLNYVGCDPQFSDFNNDGFKDLTFISGQAARGANEIRTLLIYDPKKDELIHVKNSADYPNLVYNKRLDCLDAWLFHGATTTVFLELKGDRLEPFASVNTGSHLVVDARDVRGKWHQLKIKRMNPEDVYTRYRDFHPVIPYNRPRS